MSLIIWNARGLGNPRAFRELRRLVAEKDPTLLFLSETKMRGSECRIWKNRLGFSGSFMVDCIGRSGGLALLWKESVDVILKSYSIGHIDCVIKDSGNEWRFTGIYGHPQSSLRHFSWDLLRRLKGMNELRDLPWLVGGDFNEICFDTEKIGGNKRPPSQMQAFREALEVCELQDIYCYGDPFTWVNRRSAENMIFERLDRFVGNLQWRLLFPAARAFSLEFYHSDHRPIHLVLKNSFAQRSSNTINSTPLFRFEKLWLTEEDCGEVIKRGWETNVHGTLFERISSCKNELQAWANQRFKNIPKQLKDMRAQLNKLRNSRDWDSVVNKIKELEHDIELLATKEELYWRQRSRISWLKDGDRNSRFFHVSASKRRTRNSIHGLVSSHGDWCTDSEGMAKIVFDYFGSLFTSNNPTERLMQPVLEVVSPKVDEHMNRILCAPFTAAEIKRALFDMHPDKAPGPDGMSPLFYQKFWYVIGKDVTEAILHNLNENANFESWNDTLVTLIPKTVNPMLIKEFRPISLCNVCYKIMARAITNRLRPILSQIIDEVQSAFVPGRQITDNIIVGFETLHWMRNRKKGKTGWASLKLDMSKAYDRVEWDFLQKLMNRLGPVWIEKIMRCVRSVKYFFRVNQDRVDLYYRAED